MRLMIAAVGRLKAGPERELFEKYCDRIVRSGRSQSLGPLERIEVLEDRSANPIQRMQAESRSILSRISAADHILTLDERGAMLTSTEFASYIRDKRDQGTNSMAFVVGGPDGHDSQLRDAQHFQISLGRMTLPHGLARIVLAEQIYRAITVLAGHPYHRE